MPKEAERRPTRRQETGRRGEQLAAAHLRAEGLRIKAMNVRCPAGEIDIVAEDGDCLVFVEVRTRAGQGFGLPEESLDRRKQQKLVELAETYLQSVETLAPWRIDVIAIELTPRGDIRRLEHIENAIS